MARNVSQTAHMLRLCTCTTISRAFLRCPGTCGSVRPSVAAVCQRRAHACTACTQPSDMRCRAAVTPPQVYAASGPNKRLFLGSAARARPGACASSPLPGVRKGRSVADGLLPCLLLLLRCCCDARLQDLVHLHPHRHSEPLRTRSLTTAPSKSPVRA